MKPGMVRARAVCERCGWSSPRFVVPEDRWGDAVAEKHDQHRKTCAAGEAK